MPLTGERRGIPGTVGGAFFYQFTEDRYYLFFPK